MTWPDLIVRLAGYAVFALFIIAFFGNPFIRNHKPKGKD